MTLSNVTPVVPGAAASDGKCAAQVLASPVFDDGELIAFGDSSRKEAIVTAWKQLEYKPGPLDDAIVIETGVIEYARFYLWVPLRFLELKTVVVAMCDAHDNLLSQHIVTSADLIPPLAFPSSWTDPSRPWQHDVFLLNQMQHMDQSYAGVLVEIKGVPGADRVQIGLLPNSRPLRRTLTWRPFYIAAIEALRRSEIIRSDYDETESKKKQGVLEQALGLDSSDNALLQAGQTYQVRVTWDGRRERRVSGQPASDQKVVTGQQQSFWFQTDSKPPARLDPWVLVGLPGEAEQHVFASEAIKVVFATNNLALLYDAYGKKLQARLKPSSFHPVPSSATVPHPFPINSASLIPVKASILSPWEDGVQALLVDSCIPVSGERTRHTMVTMPIPLDLYTDYVLDIEMLDKGAADGTPGERVWRGSFTTGGFHTLDEFAKSFQIALVAHRGVHTDDVGKLDTIGVTFAGKNPQGAEFDTALTQAGLDPQPVANVPRVVVFWEPGVPNPQPTALLIDSSEPMWRSRPIPIDVTDPGPAAARRFELRPSPWLQLAQQAGGDDLVDHIVQSPGGQRALVTLKPNSRGKHIRLALKRLAHIEAYLDGPGAVDQFFTILDLVLDVAPWEETD